MTELLRRFVQLWWLFQSWNWGMQQASKATESEMLGVSQYEFSSLIASVKCLELEQWRVSRSQFDGSWWELKQRKWKKKKKRNKRRRPIHNCHGLRLGTKFHLEFFALVLCSGKKLLLFFSLCCVFFIQLIITWLVGVQCEKKKQQQHENRPSSFCGERVGIKIKWLRESFRCFIWISLIRLGFECDVAFHHLGLDHSFPPSAARESVSIRLCMIKRSQIISIHRSMPCLFVWAELECFSDFCFFPKFDFGHSSLL